VESDEAMSRADGNRPENIPLRIRARTNATDRSTA
jgi:hypothetical protein